MQTLSDLPDKDQNKVQTVTYHMNLNGIKI